MPDNETAHARLTAVPEPATDPGRHRGAAEPAPGPARWPSDYEWRKAATKNLITLAGLAVAAAGAGARPGPPLPPPGMPQWRRAASANLAALNEITTELVAATSDSPEFTALVHGVLRDCTWALGYEFQGQRPPADWTPPWDREETS